MLFSAKQWHAQFERYGAPQRREAGGGQTAPLRPRRRPRACPLRGRVGEWDGHGLGNKPKPVGGAIRLAVGRRTNGNVGRVRTDKHKRRWAALSAGREHRQGELLHRWTATRAGRQAAVRAAPDMHRSWGKPAQLRRRGRHRLDAHLIQCCRPGLCGHACSAQPSSPQRPAGWTPARRRPRRRQRRRLQRRRRCHPRCLRCRQLAGRQRPGTRRPGCQRQRRRVGCARAGATYQQSRRRSLPAGVGCAAGPPEQATAGGTSA